MRTTMPPNLRANRNPSCALRARLLGPILARAPSACSLSGPKAAPFPAAPTLIPPIASEPAAGICAGPDPADAAVVEINLDVPNPRCLRVRPDQSLVILNRSDVEIVVRLGPYETQIPPGSEGAMPALLGSYLAPGVHRIEAPPYSGPEIVLGDIPS